MDSKLKIAVDALTKIAAGGWRSPYPLRYQAKQALAAIGPIEPDCDSKLPDAGKDERAAFEAWFKGDSLGRGLLDRDTRGPGYMAIATTCAWNAWQARAALTPKPADCDGCDPAEGFCKICRDKEKLEKQAKPAQQAGQLPDGWKLVPVEPTRAMFDAAYKADDDMFSGGSAHGAGAGQIWDAMLDAAPPASAAQADDKKA